jgi:hypothetical protein
MSSKSRISQLKDFCASAFRRAILSPARAAVSYVTAMFRAPLKAIEGTKEKKEENSKWTRKVEMDMTPFMPDGPVPIDPLPSDPQPARRAIPSDFAETVIAGQRNYLPPRTFDAGSVKTSFDLNAAAKPVILKNVQQPLPANDLFAAPVKRFG